MAKPKQKAKVDKPGKRARKPEAAPAEPVASAGLRVVPPVLADPIQPELNKRELMQRVIERSEVKRRDAKPVVDAMLAVLGETLAEGRGLNLEPLGKLRVNRSEEKQGRRIVVAKLRQRLGGASADAPAAFDADDEDSDGAPD